MLTACRLVALLIAAAVGFFAACVRDAATPRSGADAALALVDTGIQQACEGLAIALAINRPSVDAEKIIRTTCRVEKATRELRDGLLNNQLELARRAGVDVEVLLHTPDPLLPAPPPALADRPGDAGAPQ